MVAIGHAFWLLRRVVRFERAQGLTPSDEARGRERKEEGGKRMEEAEES